MSTTVSLNPEERNEKFYKWLQSFPGIKNSYAQRQNFDHCLNKVMTPFPVVESASTKAAAPLICPPTFDGYGCWNQTAAGTRAYISCPEYVIGFDPHRKAFKDCLPDGSWFKHPKTQKIWSNYTTCIDINDYELRKKVVSIYIAGYAISLLAVLLGLLIFWKLKNLNCTRIQIHQQLFLSFIGNNLTRIIWHSLIGNTQILIENRISCQVVHVLAQYFMSCNYMWMFCEGLYLHTVIVMAMLNIKHMMIILCLVGWGLPILLVIPYFITRKLNHQTSACWTDESHYKWIIDGPIIISLIVSFIFLCNIIRILVAKLNSFNTPECNQTRIFYCIIIIPAIGVLRKAAKATLILLPLLGIHFLVMPIHPPKGSRWEAVYEYVSVVLVSFQGLFVAAIFCFLNSEVISSVKAIIKLAREKKLGAKKYSNIPMVNGTANSLLKKFVSHTHNYEQAL